MKGWQLPRPWQPTTMLHLYRVGTQYPLTNLYVGYFESGECLEAWVREQGFSESAGHSVYNPALRLWAYPTEFSTHQWHRLAAGTQSGFSIDATGNICFDGRSMLNTPPRRIDPAQWNPAEFATVTAYAMPRHI